MPANQVAHERYPPELKERAVRMVLEDFEESIGRQATQVTYVQGSAVTDPVGGGYGPFTGSATAQGGGYHLVLLQPANEIEDNITITLSNGGNDITGTGQLNLQAGNNQPCAISSTPLGTSTSVPTSAPTTTTTAPLASTTTTVAPPPPSTTTHPANTSSAARCTAQAIAAAVESTTQAPTSLSSFACSGSFAYADVVISPTPGQSDRAFEILMPRAAPGKVSAILVTTALRCLLPSLRQLRVLGTAGERSFAVVLAGRRSECTCPFAHWRF